MASVNGWGAGAEGRLKNRMRYVTMVIEREVSGLLLAKSVAGQLEERI